MRMDLISFTAGLYVILGIYKLDLISFTAGLYEIRNMYYLVSPFPT
jgi:hypothetical protein